MSQTKWAIEKAFQTDPGQDFVFSNMGYFVQIVVENRNVAGLLMILESPV
jgi:hypothetical protein